MLQTKFIERTKELLREEYDAFEAALDTLPPVSIRVNQHKRPEVALPHEDECSFKENILHVEAEHRFSGNVPWCKTGRYLPKRPSFTFDPLFHAGTYYVQEAASMFLEQAVMKIIAKNVISSELTCEEPSSTSGQKAMTALDLCAAPGGKSTLMQTLLPEDSLLVSNEVIRSRSMILAENMTKWGLPNNIVTNNDPKDIGQLTHFFDIILADLPCSGEGMFRKDAASRDEWSVDNVKLCASRQRRIIHDVWNALKPGGWLIYSTCTFNTEENEDNVYALAAELGAELVSIPVKEEWNIADAQYPANRAQEKPGDETLTTDASHCNKSVYRFFPHRTKGEGFFLALMQKNGTPQEAIKTKEKTKNSTQPTTIPEQIKNMLSNPEKFTFYASKKFTPESIQPTKQQTKRAQETTTINAIPEIHKDIYNQLSKQLNIISAGIFMGELKGKDFIPATPLAMSTELQKEAFISVDLPYEQAIKYLQREAITMPKETPTGYTLITFKNTPLGFAKNIGNRANNLYPQEWRIRSATAPSNKP